jgi:hypothetical protein
MVMLLLTVKTVSLSNGSRLYEHNSIINKPKEKENWKQMNEQLLTHCLITAFEIFYQLALLAGSTHQPK